MKKTNISFIVPAYNCATFLPDAINSIFNENFKVGDEVIIVDDASTDNTLLVAKHLQKKYSVINIFIHHYNKGSGAAGRNTGIDNSKNDLIFCLDADNILSPNSIPKLKKYMLSKCAEVVSFGELHYFKEIVQNVTHRLIFNPQVSLADCLKGDNFPGASGNYLFSKHSWLKAGRYNESIGGAYDSWVFGFCQLASGCKMITMPNSFYFHRYGYESTFVKDNKKNKPSIVVLQGILPFIRNVSEKDIEYILSPEARYIWFENLKNHPINLESNISILKKALFNKINKLSKIK